MAIVGLTVDIANRTMTVDDDQVNTHLEYFAVVNDTVVRRGKLIGISYSTASPKPMISFRDNSGNIFDFVYDSPIVFETADEARTVAITNYTAKLDAQIADETVEPAEV